MFTTAPLETALTPNLTLRIGQPSDLLFSAADVAVRQQFGLVLLFLAAVAVGGVVGGERYVMRPLAIVERTARKLTAGDLSARVPDTARTPGFVDLADALDEMVVALQERGRQRDAAEAAFREAEDRYQGLFKDNPLPTWVYDLNTLQFLEVNDAAIVQYGYSRAEFLAMRILDIRPPQEVPGLLAVVRPNRPAFQYHRNVRHAKKSGQIIEVDVASHTIAFEGRPAVLVVAQDVTDREEAVRAVQAAEERMRFALNAAQVGIWESNLASNESYWSEMCERLHGLEPRTFGGTVEAFLAGVHPDDRQRVMDAVRQGRGNRGEIEYEYRTIWPSGAQHWMHCLARYSYDAEGRPLRGAGIVIDVTDRRLLEDQFRQAQKLEAVGRLAGGVAHDFNNLLTAILGFSEMIEEEIEDPAAARKDLDEVRKAAVSAASLTRQLLAFSRKQVLQPQVLNVNGVVSRAESLLRRTIGEDVTLTLKLSRAAGAINADPGQIEQIVMNLAVNARDAMPNGGRLTIETGNVDVTAATAAPYTGLSPGSYVMLAVADTGIGMDDATKARLFEPFFTTKPEGKGTGLGLATVYGIVQQSGGAIRVESEPRRGTRFTIFFPRVAGGVQSDDRDTADEGRGEGNETILVVEDQDVVRAMVSQALTARGYRVLAARTGAEALDLARRHASPIHLLLTDVIMPAMKGPELAEILGTSLPGMHALYMSGYTDQATLTQPSPTSKVGFIQKPFSPDALVRQIRRMLDSAA